MFKQVLDQMFKFQSIFDVNSQVTQNTKLVTFINSPLLRFFKMELWNIKFVLILSVPSVTLNKGEQSMGPVNLSQRGLSKKTTCLQSRKALRPKLFDLIQNITENGLRRASGPVHAIIPSVFLILLKKINFSRRLLLQTIVDMQPKFILAVRLRGFEASQTSRLLDYPSQRSLFGGVIFVTAINSLCFYQFHYINSIFSL